MFMPSAQNRFLLALSAVVLVSLFLCQVVGALCPMGMPTAMAEPAIQDAMAGHPMGGGNVCADSLPSSSKPSVTPDAHQALPLDASDQAIGIQPPSFGHQAVGSPPARSGPPLHTRLSVFRI
jgi:hypothetical protein